MSSQNSALRTLAPKPTFQDDENPADVDSALGKRKRSQHPSACLPCRNRKSKCDGNRTGPCSVCARKKTACEYELGVGETRISSLQKENLLLQGQVSQHEALMEFIRTSNQTDAEAVFRKLRYGATANKSLGLSIQASSQPRDTHDHTHEGVSYRSHQNLYDSQQSYSAVRTSPTSASTVSDSSTKLSSVSPITSYGLPVGQPPTLYGGRPYEAQPKNPVERSAHTTDPSAVLMRAPPPPRHGHYNVDNRLPPLGNMLPTPRPAKRHEQMPTAEPMEPVPVWHGESIQPYHSTDTLSRVCVSTGFKLK